MSSLSPEARAIIDAALPGEQLDADACGRLKRQILLATGAVAAGATAVAAGEVAAATKVATGAAASTALIPMSGGVAVLTKIGLGVVLVGGLGLGAHQLMVGEEPAPIDGAATSAVQAGSPDPARPEESAVPSPQSATVTAPAPADGADEDAADDAIAADGTANDTAPDRVPAPAVGKPTGSTLAAETALLQRAQRELQSGNPEKALALLNQHRGQHESGVLREERQAAQVLALCRAGRGDQARAEAQRFVAEFPRSPHRARVLSVCAGPK